MIVRLGTLTALPHYLTILPEHPHSYAKVRGDTIRISSIMGFLTRVRLYK